MGQVYNVGFNLSKDYWLEPDNLLLLNCWARDGYTVQDIANKIGIHHTIFRRWMNEEEEIREAINTGRELVDYKVENALLKAALGYRTKEVKLTTVIRGGKVVEKIKEVTTSDVAPHVGACKTWLFNRKPNLWKAESARANLLDDLGQDTDVRIVIERAGSKAGEEKSTSVYYGAEAEQTEEDQEWQDEVNSGITIRGATEQEQKEAKKKIAKEKREKKKRNVQKSTEVLYESNDVERQSDSAVQHAHDSNSIDLDAWPDDWVDDDET